MSSLVEVQEAVRALPDEEFDAFVEWFDRYEEDRWDRQIEHDQQSGPLHAMMEKARADFAAGDATLL